MRSKRTKKVTSVNKKTLVVAVDIGKHVNYAYFRAPDNEEVKPFPFHNSEHGFEGFFIKVIKFKEEQGLEDIIIGYESTGCYAEPLCHYLKKKPVKLVQVNPMHTKRIKEVTGNSPNKTDKKDPRVIANLILLGNALTVVIPEGSEAELRSLTHARERAVKDQTVKKNQLQDLVFRIFPEFLNIMKGISSKSALYLLKNHPLPEDIIDIGIDCLCDIFKKVSRGKLGIDRAKELFEASRISIGIDQGKQSIISEIEYLVCQIESADKFIFFLEKQMEEYLKEIHYSKSILSIKGISTITTAGLIGEVGDFREFDTIEEIMKLAGLDLFEVSSGKHKGERHISKRGRSLMRKLLYYAAVNAVKSHGIMHYRYHQMLSKGKPKIKALTAIARRLLKLIFALARDNTKYVEDFEHRYKSDIAA